MQSKQFSAALKALGLSYAEFGRQLSEATGGNYSRQRVYEWATGRRDVPRVAVLFVERELADRGT